ncbi:hypothetical protein EU528_05640 [Candidatus Thorarchaeota archaeon]|nr:MAG: hypothetical protein EU528_05640 [Candidatus Thorarchaeota archaeon]
MVDVTTHGTASFTTQSSDDTDVELELVSESESSVKVKQVVLASVLASLSIAIAPVAEFIPRIPGWGIAIFDPVSIFWIISFLIGGIWVGLVSTVAGTMGLFLYDPTAIGPVFKLIATLPMIIVPWYGVRKLRSVVRGETLSNTAEPLVTRTYDVPDRESSRGGDSLSRPKFYATLMLLAFVLRLVLMVPINLAYGAIAFPFLTLDFIINYAIILNSFQSLWDALIPFIIVYPSGVFKTFKMW